MDGSVGWNGANSRPDVGKVETLLGRSGHLDIGKTDGPTGYFGRRVEDAAKNYQKDHGLKRDGHLNPGGETISAMANTTEIAQNPGGKRPKGPVAPTKPTVDKPERPTPPEVPGVKQKVDGKTTSKPPILAHYCVN